MGKRIRRLIESIDELEIMQYEIIEYEERYGEQVKDLLVELQAHLSALDERHVLVLKESYREEYFAYVLQQIAMHDGKMFLACRDGAAVGLVVCKVFRGGEEQDITTSCPKIGFISDLVVAKRHRGNGIGTALLSAAEKYFRSKDCEYTQLIVFAPNVGAKRLYEKYGFETNSFYMSKRLEKL